MTDKREPLNFDLETAEHLVIAMGKPELAEALNYHAHGVRNLVQGEWGKSFVTSLEGLLVKYIEPLRADMKEWATESAARLGKHDDEIEALQAIVAAHDARFDQIETTVAQDIQHRLGALEAHDARFDQIEASLAQLVSRIGDALPTEADQDLSARLRKARHADGS